MIEERLEELIKELDIVSLNINIGISLGMNPNIISDARAYQKTLIKEYCKQELYLLEEQKKKYESGGIGW